MYGGNAMGVELVFRTLLGDLCFVDERESELREELERLRYPGLYGPTGTHGALREHIRGPGDRGEEVGSVFLGIADRLGYVQPDRRLSTAEWKAMRTGLRAAIRSRDWTTEELLARFGEPSIRMGHVFGYASEEQRAGWVFFDFLQPERWDRRDEALLRDARLPATTLARQLVYTPTGVKLKKARSSQMKA